MHMLIWLCVLFVYYLSIKNRTPCIIGHNYTLCTLHRLSRAKFLDTRSIRREVIVI